MNEALLLVHNASNCHACEFCIYCDGHYRCTRTKYPYEIIKDCERKAEWCPLVPIPLKACQLTDGSDSYSNGYCDGWNACIDKIKGELNET